MEDGVDLVFAQGALEQVLVADIAAHDLDPIDQAGPHQLALRHPVADQAHHIRAALQQAPYQPAAEQPRGARDQRRTVAPEVHSQIFHGASPFAHRSFKY